MSDCLEIDADKAAGLSPWRGPYAFRAFRHRNYALLWTGQLISLTGTWMQALSLPWLIFTLTGSKLLLGIVAAASMLPSLIVTLPSGVIADRFSKRRIVIATQTVLMTQALTLAALTFTHTIQVWHIIALAAFAGFANAMDMPTRQAMVVELVGKQDLQNAVALNSSMFQLTRIAGPFVGGVILAVVGPAWCFLINAISYIGAIVGLLLMKNVRAKKRASRDEPMLKQIAEGFNHVWGNVLMRDMLIMTGITTVFLAPYGIFFPVYALRIFKVGTTGQGIMMACVGLGALAAAMTISSVGHRFEPKTIVFVGAIVAPAGLVAFSLCSSFYAALGCLIAVGVGMMSFMASSNTIMQVAAPAPLVGRVMSLRALVLFGLGAPGAVMMGRLAEVKHVGVQGTVLMGALVGLITSIYFALASRTAREAAFPPASTGEQSEAD